jgi:hypothetical protein
MDLTRVAKQFHVAPGVTEQLAAEFILPMVTMGAHLALAHVPHPLRVVSVVLRPRAEVGVRAPPSIVAFTEYEPPASLEDAKARGWEMVPGLRRQRVEALHATQAFLAHRGKIGDFAMANHLPLFTRAQAWPWFLLSYGVDWPDLFRLVARQIIQILKGVRPADLPVQQATKFEMVINLKTAKALGLTIPETLLLRADQVIQ